MDSTSPFPATPSSADSAPAIPRTVPQVPPPRPFPGAVPAPSDRPAVAATLVVAAAVLALGALALVAPGTYRDLVGLDAPDVSVRLVGALTVGVGAAVVLAVAWHDAILVALAGTAVGGALASVTYATTDGVAGGAPALYAGVTVAALAAFVVRYRARGLLVGDLGPGTDDPVLARFVRQKTVLLTTFKRDGTEVGTPVSIVVDGDRAYVRSYAKAFKTLRIRNNPEVRVAPSTARGRVTGTAFRAHARRLGGAEDARARHLLGRKQPLLHGVAVPWMHRVAHGKTGDTVHFEITPVEA